MRFRGVTLFLILTSLGVLALGGTQAFAKKNWFEPWDIYNDPLLWIKNPIVDLNKLPRMGASKIPLYSGHAWSQYRGGFAWRPRTPMDRPRSEDIDYKILTKEAAINLPKAELATLSPAEKLSLINCDYDFKLVTAEWAINAEVMNGARSKIKEKEKAKSKISATDIQYGTAGFCHLVSELPVYFDEPKDTVIPGCDGLMVPVTSADLKAFGMMSLRKTFESRKHNMMGRECANSSNPDRFCATCAEKAVKESNADDETKKSLLDKLKKYYWSDKKQEEEYVKTHDCKDINPGSLEILMGNVLGKEGRPLMMDRDQDGTIWNRAIKSYKSKELKTLKRRSPTKNAAIGTTVEIPMEMEIEFITNVDSNEIIPGAGTQPIASTKKKIQYYLEIRENKKTGENEILGGSWLTQDHPDLFWTPRNPASDADVLLTGEFEKLKGFLNPRSNEELK